MWEQDLPRGKSVVTVASLPFAQSLSTSCLPIPLLLPVVKLRSKSRASVSTCPSCMSIYPCQVSMSVCGEGEDVVSMAMSALRGLMDKWAVNPGEVGRLEVGPVGGRRVWNRVTRCRMRCERGNLNVFLSRGKALFELAI